MNRMGQGGDTPLPPFQNISARRWIAGRRTAKSEPTRIRGVARATETPCRHCAQSIANADGSIRAFRRTIPAAAPSSSNSNLMPSASIARRIDARLLAVGVLCPLSKSWTVLSETLARFASSPCDQPSHPRAARLCSGVMPWDAENYGMSIILLDAVYGHVV